MNMEQGRKQHLNLSCMAYEIIQSDRNAFGQATLSGFLNGVFRSYYEAADATVDYALAGKRQELMEILRKLPDSEEKAQVCTLFLERERQRLAKQVTGYPKAYGFKFYLNVENATTLEEKAEMIGEYYHAHPALYLKAVVEEYAAHTSLERERIFFHETIELLETCIEGGYLVTVETGGVRYDVKPWQIMPDEGGLYHYLIGLSCPAGEDSSSAIPASFRISRITMLKKRPKSFRSGKLTLLEQDMLRQALNERGAAFLIGKPEEITVRLTEEGQRLFNNKLFLRPIPSQTEENGTDLIHTFRCTPHQIQSYFLSFGAEAEILAPAHLRERFRTILNHAAHLYEEKKG